MLLLTFRINDQDFAIDVSPVIEVIPYVKLREWPCAEAGVAGLLNYRGEVVPVVDLSLLVSGNGAARLLSSRIVVVECSSIGKLALLVEGATETTQFDRDAVQSVACTSSALPCLGNVLVSEDHMTQLIDVELLVTEKLSEAFNTQRQEESV